MPRKKTHEEFVKEVFELFGDEYEILGTYKNANEKIRIKHVKCNHTYETKPCILLGKHGCPECAKKIKSVKARKSHQQFIEELTNLFGDEYEVLENYQTSSIKIKVKHNKCGNAFSTTPQDLLSSKKVNKKFARCPHCNVFTRNLESIKIEIDELTDGEYKFIDTQYRGVQKKHKLLHKICNHEWDTNLSNFIYSGHRCPKCNSSKGEVLIDKFLKSNNVKFETQFRFDDCRYKKPLPFDFAILENNNVKFLIEYDGDGHFRSKSCFGGDDGFKLTQKRDQIKNTYCKDNSISLYRIPYWKFNDIELILNKLINNEYVEVNDNFIVQ